MMTFELKNATEVKIKSVTNRVEKHGDEDVPAISITFHYNGPNTTLDLIDKSLRPTFYERTDTKDIPGVEPTTPKLRTRAVDRVKLRNAWEEMRITIEHGIGDTPDSITSVKAGDCKVHKFKELDLHDGGMVDFDFLVSTSDISEKDAGILWSLNGHAVRLTLLAPTEAEKKKEQKAPVIDGTVGHPGAKKGDKKADKTADLFDTDGKVKAPEKKPEALTPEKALANSVAADTKPPAAGEAAAKGIAAVADAIDKPAAKTPAAKIAAKPAAKAAPAKKVAPAKKAAPKPAVKKPAAKKPAAKKAAPRKR